MALSTFAKQQLRFAVGDASIANEVATLIDTHAAGTLSSRTKRALRAFYGSAADAASFITAVQASSALAATDVAKLGCALGSRKAADLIAAELIA